MTPRPHTPGPGTAPTPAPKTVLIVAPSWVGDATMATPAFRAIASAWPSTRRVLLCRPGINEVLGGLPFDEVVVDRLGGALGPLRGAGKLRAIKADLAILFPNSFRVALAVRAAGIRQRIGYARDGRGFLLTTGVATPSERPASTLDGYCDLVEQGLGIPVTDRRPMLALVDADRDSARAALGGGPDAYAVLVPGGNNPAKRWPAERFARIAELLFTRHGLSSLIAGSPGERELIDSIRAASTCETVSLAERSLGLGALKAIIAGARIVVTNDTGPRHIAAAFGVPTVALFGPTDHRWTRLSGVPERLLVAEPFLPEELVADDRPEFCRMERISVGDVEAAIDSLLAERAAEEAVRTGGFVG